MYRISAWARGQRPYFGLTEQERQDIESKLQARTEAKKQKNYVLADSIRDELKSQGIEIMDTPQGSTWEKI